MEKKDHYPTYYGQIHEDEFVTSQDQLTKITTVFNGNIPIAVFGDSEQDKWNLQQLLVENPHYKTVTR